MTVRPTAPSGSDGARLASPPTLLRGLGLLETSALVVGGIIGASLFVNPAIVAAGVGAPGLALLVWTGSGLLATCGALCFAELSASIPATGGTYAFLRRAYGDSPVAFLFGWTMFFATSPASVAAVGAIVGVYAGALLERLVPLGVWGTRGLAVAVILAVTTINWLGVRLGGRTQNLLTGLKVGGIVVIIGLAFAFGGPGARTIAPLLPAGVEAPQIVASIGPMMILTLFSFSGWYFPTHVAGEIRRPSRSIPVALMIGMAVVMVINVSMNLAVFSVLPFAQVQSSERVVADAMEALFGASGSTLATVVLLVSAIGALNAQMLNYPRITFAMARDGLFFAPLSRIHRERRTPSNAILVIGAVASVYALAGTFTEILTAVGFIAHLFLTLGVVAVIVLRVREPELPRPFRVPGYPVTPALFLLVSLWYLTSLLQTRLMLSAVGIMICLAGLPLFYRWSRGRARGRRYGGQAGSSSQTGPRD